MKIKINKGIDRDLYIIYFGAEIFNAYYDKEYPRLGQWTLHRYRPEYSNSIFNMYYPCGLDIKFKDLKEIKKYIKDRKWL
jgi:hypothetical protein|tara:strand:- start:375 stop:614 length:240 start_codon:yes stop_codon:yes gene_type:complete